MSTVAQCKMAAGVRGKEREGVREREIERDVEWERERESGSISIPKMI